MLVPLSLQPGPKKLPVVVLEERYGRSILPRAVFEGFPSTHDCADGAVVKIVVGLLQGRFALCARPTMPTPRISFVFSERYASGGFPSDDSALAHGFRQVQALIYHRWRLAPQLWTDPTSRSVCSRCSRHATGFLRQWVPQ